ncbi:unnamed protein product [Thlaspi arvense]|uniref:Uncharacterized protein n=1 Tax=Thlaspi arvense TaxID=13288 RepID=A0AAU9RK90_THLAR|nr:unnamed protein product [Thlaspi arvense]
MGEGLVCSVGAIDISLFFAGDLDEKMRDALHRYIEERGVNESLFPFLQAWLYVKDHRSLVHWFKSVGTFINDRKKVPDC